MRHQVALRLEVPEEWAARRTSRINDILDSRLLESLLGEQLPALAIAGTSCRLRASASLGQ
jgi:hypothetical protein